MALCTSCKPLNGPLSAVLAKQSGTPWLGVQVARWQSDVLCSRAAQTVSVVKIQEIAISNYIPHPANVVAVALSPLRTDAGEITESSRQLLLTCCF